MAEQIAEALAQYRGVAPTVALRRP